MTSPAPPLILDSLRRRMRAMHSLYEDAVASMELHHVNHFERDGVLPIAFSLFHYINMQDVTSGLLMGEAPVWATGELAGPRADGDRRPRQGAPGQRHDPPAGR